MTATRRAGRSRFAVSIVVGVDVNMSVIARVRRGRRNREGNQQAPVSPANSVPAGQPVVVAAAPDVAVPLAAAASRAASSATRAALSPAS